MSSSLAFLRLFAAALSAAWTALPPKALVSVAALPAAALALLTAPVAMVPAQHAAFGRHLNGLPGCHVSLPVAMPTGTVASGSGRRSSAVGQQPERDGEHVLSGALGEHTCTVARMVAFTWLLWTSLTRTIIDIKYMEAIIFLSPAVLFLLVVVISLGANSEESNTSDN